jgi:hypothetical protein
MCTHKQGNCNTATQAQVQNKYEAKDTSKLTKGTIQGAVSKIKHTHSEETLQVTQNTQLDSTINRKIYCFVVQTLLNMFWALQCPSSGARQTAVAASGFRMNVEVDVC